MKEAILQMLKSGTDFISGQDLCEYFKVSRTAVWKVINQLKEEGYEIEAVNRKGYRLVSSPDILSESEILSGLSTEVLGKKIYRYDCIGTTNDQARMLAENGAPDGSLVIAETQDRGKGRRGRGFFAPPGSGIWMSLILKPEIPPVEASMITLLGAMAVLDMLESYGLSGGIKWPNDLVADKKKITGILTEMSAGPDQINYIVLGIGINVNMKDFPEELRANAISMAMISGKTYHRAEVIQRVMKSLEKYYRMFLDSGNLAFMKEKYNERLVHMNKEISVHEIRRVWKGVSRGINDIGELIVSTDAGDTIVRSGEVSIRGVYGYAE